MFRSRKLKRGLLLSYAAVTLLAGISGLLGGATLQQGLSIHPLSVNLLILAAVAAVWLLALVLGARVAGGIARSLEKCAQRLTRLAEGDLTTPTPDLPVKDEMGALAASIKLVVNAVSAILRDVESFFSGMRGDVPTDPGLYTGEFSRLLQLEQSFQRGLSDTLTQLGQCAGQVAAGSEQVALGAQTLAQGAVEQAGAIEALTQSITELSENARTNAENSRAAMEHSRAAGGEVEASARHMGEMVEAMERISISSGEIGKIISTIETIAFQTNLLALNAAVEAARAGPSGKGFAVVAGEVRNLATKSDRAAKATRELIESSVNTVREGSQIVQKVSDTLRRTTEAAELAVGDMGNIAAAAEAEALAIRQVTVGLDQIASVVQTNSATSQESAAASEELSSQAALMKELVLGLGVRGGGVPPERWRAG